MYEIVYLLIVCMLVFILKNRIDKYLVRMGSFIKVHEVDSG